MPVVLAGMQASGWFAGCRGVAPTCGTWRFRGSAPGRSSGLRGVAQQALGCSARFGADFDAAEHARQFFLALPCIELLHRALGDAVAGGLADPVVRVALRGDLRQVGDRKSTRLNPVTNAHLVCRLLLEKKTNTLIPHNLLL